MATTTATVRDRSVSIGRVFGRGFGTIGANPLATLGIALLFSAVPSTLLGFGLQNMQAETFLLLGAAGTIGIALLTVVISILLSMITQGALVRATVAHSGGRRASLGESAMAGLAVAGPLFLLGLLSAIGIGLGLVLLLVPGIMLYVIWSVAAPALVEERLGPVEALGRSRFLTRGARWKIFGLSLVILVVYWLISAVVGMVGITMYGGVEKLAVDLQDGMPLPYLIFNALVQTVVAAVWGAIQASLYVELRDWKDGPAADKLAEVFA
jgi:hypothetical protein